MELNGLETINEKKKLMVFLVTCRLIKPHKLKPMQASLKMIELIRS